MALNKYFPRTTFSENPSDDIKNVDAIIVPGGNLDRVNYFASLNFSSSVPVILTGNHHILADDSLPVESTVAETFLRRLANSNDEQLPTIFSENESVDHLSAAYFAKDTIENLLGNSENKTVGIVSDKPNIYTFAHCLDWNLSKEISFVGFPTNFGDNLKNWLYSFVLVEAWKHDLKKIGGKTPYENVILYMNKKHPYFSENLGSSQYGGLVNLAGFAKNLSSNFKK